MREITLWNKKANVYHLLKRTAVNLSTLNNNEEMYKVYAPNIKEDLYTGLQKNVEQY